MASAVRVCTCQDWWRTAQGLWMCAQCGRKTSATAGTIFHRSHTPLSTWLAAIWFVTSQKNGVSALGLQDALGFGSYETAWAWLQKLRRAMVRPDRELLSGVVELDETSVGGRSHGKPGGSSDKVPVMVAVERLGPHQLGRVRFGVGDAPGILQLLQFAPYQPTGTPTTSTSAAAFSSTRPSRGCGTCPGCWTPKAARCCPRP